MIRKRFALSILLILWLSLGPCISTLSRSRNLTGYLSPPNVSSQNEIVVDDKNQEDIASTQDAGQSAKAAIQYLARVMDQFHNRFPVYDDVSSAGNHFYALAKIPDGNAPVKVNGSSTNSPHTGATAIRCELLTGGPSFGGIYFQNGILPAGAQSPQPNFGTVPNAGINLTGASALTFWARGEHGGEKIEFFMGGVGRDPATGNPTAPYPDSTPRRPVGGTLFHLTTSWQQFTIDLTALNLSYVLGGFAWVASINNNSSGAVFYLDDIQYELSNTRRTQRLNEPHFLRSFTTLPFQVQPAPVRDFDFVLRNSAFTYDNAMALLAFLADGASDSLRRAKIIGNAFVYASQHDRFYTDGRLRSDYAAGDISLPPGWTPNNRVGTVPIPGYYIESQQKFQEIEQKAIDTGNNAWAMIALLALYRRTSGQTYLTAARKLGNFIHTFRNDTGTYRGFQGGLDNYPEGNPPGTRRVYASTEHNLDVYAAFKTMGQLTGEPQWQSDAQHARQFVEAMWDTQKGCYLAGTTNPETRNTISNQLPVDVQAWSVLALPNTLALHPQVLQCAEQNHRNMHDGFSGFDFNNDKDGVWFEGTAQMAVAYAAAAQSIMVESLRGELRRAQMTPPFGDGNGVVAASHEGLSTGFNFKYFRRLHVGATAWNVFAQLAVNPYYQNKLKIAFSISGKVTVSGTGLIGVKMTLSSPIPAGFAPRTAMTTSTGSYSFSNVPGGRNYRLTPSKINYSFTPTSRSYSNLNVDKALQNFTATLKSEHMTMGNPSNATADINHPTNYLLIKAQYVLSYHRDHGTANWVSWHLDLSWLGNILRQDDFRADTSLPGGWYQVRATDYANSGFDRGHMCPSADRTKTVEDNSATFLMTNMIPQAPDNNRGIWADLEDYGRTLVREQGKEVYIISGGLGSGGMGSNGGTTTTIAEGHVLVPAKTWKVLLVLPAGDNDLSRVTTTTRTIAVIIPNKQGVLSDDWRSYRVNVDEVEAQTGYNFFSNVPVSIQNVIEARVDDQ